MFFFSGSVTSFFVPSNRLHRNLLQKCCYILESVYLSMNQILRSFTTVLDLKRSFEREPLRLEVDLGKQAEFLCAPPDGQPPPSVYWRKQDKDLLEGEGEATPLSTETHPNYHISNNGSKSCIKLLTSLPPPPLTLPPLNFKTITTLVSTF